MGEKDFIKNRRELVKIDFHNLHENWQTQADLLMEYSDASAEMTLRLDKIKERMGIREAELDSYIRTNPSQYGIDRITDSAIKAQVIADEECREYREQIIDLTFELNIIKGAIKSHEKRSKALEWISQLWIKNYFAIKGPQLDKEMLRESIDKKIDSEYRKDLESSNLRRKLTT
jgi:hypothetical protein